MPILTPTAPADGPVRELAPAGHRRHRARSRRRRSPPHGRHPRMQKPRIAHRHRERRRNTRTSCSVTLRRHAGRPARTASCRRRPGTDATTEDHHVLRGHPTTHPTTGSDSHLPHTVLRVQPTAQAIADLPDRARARTLLSPSPRNRCDGLCPGRHGATPRSCLRPVGMSLPPNPGTRRAGPPPGVVR